LAATHRLLAGFVIVVAAMSTAACVLAPADNTQSTSYALPEASSGALTKLEAAIEPGLGDGESAFWLLDRGDQALRARLAMFDAAESSLDVQYFIWRPEPTGRLLMDRLIQAADRGVRVRLLLDDMTVSSKDDEYVALNSHPLIEVRSYNAWEHRSLAGRVTEYLAHRAEMKHRMHFKTIVADNRLAMIGGRNIGDRYFGLYDEFIHNDLDIAAAGPVVADVSDSFDLYWNSAESYPITDVVEPRHASLTLDEFRASIEREYRAASDRLEGFPLERADWDDFFDLMAKSYVAAPGVFRYDLPMVDDTLPTQLYEPFRQMAASAVDEVLIVTAYFIPDQELVDLFASLTARGVRVVVLTNSLGSNNHAIAHTGYRRWRRKALAAGIELYEARSDAHLLQELAVGDVEPGWLGLHAKAMVVDGHECFVGTPNVDPRSFVLNSESAFFVDSPELGAELGSLVERDIAPQNAWRVTMDDEGWLKWTGNPDTLTRQPARGFSQRLEEFFVNMLPLKDQV
jgi:putative cardiolipin synthase